MGEYAELALAQEWADFEVLAITRHNKFKEFRAKHADKWMTINGDILNIEDMQTKHIENCIKLLERANQTHYIVYEGLVKELAIRQTE